MENSDDLFNCWQISTSIPKTEFGIPVRKNSWLLLIFIKFRKKIKANFNFFSHFRPKKKIYDRKWRNNNYIKFPTHEKKIRKSKKEKIKKSCTPKEIFLCEKKKMLHFEKTNQFLVLFDLNCVVLVHTLAHMIYTTYTQTNKQTNIHT